MTWTAPSTVTVGQIATAAFWNQQVRDNLNALGGGMLFARDDTQVSATSATYADPATGTVGPSVTAPRTQNYIVLGFATAYTNLPSSAQITFQLGARVVGGSDYNLGVGYNTLASTLGQTFTFTDGKAIGGIASIAATAGQVIKLIYAFTAGGGVTTGYFYDRSILVIPS